MSRFHYLLTNKHCPLLGSLRCGPGKDLSIQSCFSSVERKGAMLIALGLITEGENADQWTAARLILFQHFCTEIIPADDEK